MALNKTTAELKVIETALPEKVAQKAGQVILSDDGKFFYDNTVKGRTRINPDGLKLVDTSSVSVNSVVTPLTSMCCNTSYKILRLETSYNEDGWLGTATPESISLNSQYYCYIPKTGEIQDKFWEMLESDNVFIQQASSVTVNDVSYAAFTIQLIYNGGGTASDAQTLSGTLIRYPAPADSSDTYFNLALRVTDYDDSASNAQAIFESGYAFNTLRVRVRILNTMGAYVTWTGTNIQAIHGSQESADSPITFAAPIQIRNPQTGEIESIQTQEGGYVKFLGFDTVRNAIARFDEGEEGIIQVTNSEDVNLIYASFPFEPTWVSGNIMNSSSITTALPLPYKVLKNAASVYFFRGSPNADDFAYGHISSILNDCGSFCIVNIVIDNIDDLSISLDDVTAETSGITHVDVEYTVSAVSGEAIWYHTNEYGVKFIEVIVPPVILDEVDEEADQPVRSSAIAKYIRDNVAGVYKFKGSLETSLAEAILSNPEAYNVVAGYVYNVVDSGTILTIVPIGADVIQLINTDASTNTIAFNVISTSLHIDDDYLVDLEIDFEGESILLPVVSVQAFSSNNATITVSATANFTIEDAETKSITPVAWRGQLKLNAGDNIVWNGRQWDKLAGTVDLSSYATKSEVQAVKSDLTCVLRYCGSIYCNENDSAVTTSSLRIGDVYNVYFYSDDGWGTIKLNNSDTEVVISDDGTATFVGTSIETRNGGRSETANYLRMDIAAIKSQTLTEYHWILVPTSDSFSSYTITEYDSDQPPAAGTYQVTEVSIYVDKQDNGINVVWDGVGFDRLSPAIDMSTYLSKSEIGSVVSSTETMPVSGKAVDAAIKSAVSSVYKFKGSVTTGALSRQVMDGYQPDVGDVYNVLNDGSITQHEPVIYCVNLSSYVNSNDEEIYELLFDLSGMAYDYSKEDKYTWSIYCETTDGGTVPIGYSTISVYEEEDSNELKLVVTMPKLETDELVSSSDLNWDASYISCNVSQPELEVKAGDNVVFTQKASWDKLSSTIDLSPYVTVDQLNTVKADISHVYRYKGDLSQLANSASLSDLQVGDVYVEAGNWSGPLEFYNLTGTIADSGSSVVIPGLYAYSNMHIPTDPRVIVELTYVGTDGELGTAIVDGCVGGNLTLSSADSNWPDTEGTQVEIDTYAVKFGTVAIGDNLAWNGWTFDVLGSYVDLSPYQLKSGVTSKVASGNTNPVQSGAVYDAIQAAISSVYKPMGSYTVEFINNSYNDSPVYCSDGCVVNVVNDGHINQTPWLLDYNLVTASLVSTDLTDSDNNIYTVTVLMPESFVWQSDTAIIQCKLSNYTDFEYDSDTRELTIRQVSGEAIADIDDGGDIFISCGLASFDVVAGDNIVWTNRGWDKLAGTVDLTGYQTKLEFASEITSENASKAVTAGPVKSYVDSEISKFLESSGSIMNLVGSGQATVLAEYTWSEDTTYAAGEEICTLQFSSPAYKVIIPERGISGSTWQYNIYSSTGGSFTSRGNNYLSNDAFIFEVIAEDLVLDNSISHDDGYLGNSAVVRSGFGGDIDHITLTSTQSVTMAAGMTVKIYGWPVVQESDTATSINEMLKEIYDTQEAFKAQTSIPDSDSGVKTYTSLDNLPAAANSGAVAAVTSDSNTSARGMYMFINGSWQRLAFAGESLVDGDTVEVSIE